MKRECLVSIITPIFNSSDYIEETINSVINQTYKKWEMIIVNDCSVDDSLDIVRKYMAKDKRIKLVNLKKNKGAAFCRNIAIRMSKGRYIAFLDSDDLWCRDKLAVQIKMMIETESSFSFSDYFIINKDNQVVEVTKKICYDITYNNMLYFCPVGCLTVVYEKRKFSRMYMPNIRRGQDYGFWMKLLREKPKICYLNRPLSFYRKKKGGLSSSKFKKIKDMFVLYRDILSVNTLSAAFFVMTNSLHSFLKANTFFLTKRIGSNEDAERKMTCK